MKGSIYKRGNTWTYVIDIGKDSTGKRKQKSKGGFRTKGDCQKAMDLEKYKITHDENYRSAYVSKDVVKTLGECVEEYLEVKKEDWKLTTYLNIEQALHKMSNIFHIPISQITIKNIDMLLAGNKDIQTSTKQIYKIYFKTLFNYCKEKGYVTFNIIDGYQIPKEKVTVDNISINKARNYFYERDEVNQILDKINYLKEKDIRWFQECLIIKIAIHTGMRIGEILALEIDDIQNKTIKVCKTVNNVCTTTGKYNLTTPKTMSSARYIDITDGLMSDIERQKNNVIQLRKSSNKWNDKNKFLFPRMYENATSQGLPYRRDIYAKRYKIILMESGVRYLSFHKLRHTHCSLLAHSNIPLHMIGERLGHKSADNITKEIYLHITKEYSQSIAEKFNDIIQGKC